MAGDLYSEYGHYEDGSPNIFSSLISIYSSCRLLIPTLLFLGFHCYFIYLCPYTSFSTPKK